MIEKNQPSKHNEPREKRKKLGFFGGLFLGASKDYVAESLALTTDSGMGILPSLDSIAQGTNSKRMRNIINQIKTDVADGNFLWEALESSGLFPERVIFLIKIGEKSGKLTANLKVASEQQQKEKSFNSKVKAALLYPVFVLVVAVLVGVGISWFILPQLATIFSQLNIKLPLITQIFLQAGFFLGSYGSFAVPLFIITFSVGIFIIFFFKHTNFIGRWIAFRTPIFRRIVQEMEIARFGYVVGSLLGAGVPIVESISSVKATSTFYDYRKFYSMLEQKIYEGDSFQKSFTEFKGINKLFPPPIQQTIIAGEQSGHLADSLSKIGRIYEDKLDNTTRNLATILEPVLLVIVWLGVMAVALAVILPVYGLISGIQ